MFLLIVIRWIQSLLPAHLEPSPLTGLANQQTPELFRQIGRSEQLLIITLPVKKIFNILREMEFHLVDSL